MQYFFIAWERRGVLATSARDTQTKESERPKESAPQRFKQMRPLFVKIRPLIFKKCDP